MENWCTHRATLMGFARHTDTGEPLPEDLFEKIKAAKTFRAASVMMRQLMFAAVDLNLHEGDLSGKTAFDVQRAVAKENAVLPVLDEDRFLCSFSHIFAGGYACGYYSYKWAEVLSADAFGAFEEHGVFDVATARRFLRSILERGGSRDAMEAFVEFRGRKPEIEPLLRQMGLAA
jgi:oligopeptidase A